MRRLPWLDWIRFVAAFMVLACHARGSNWVDWSKLEPASKTTWSKVFFAVTRAGLEWVVVFFVLSGLLVGGVTLSRALKGNFRATHFAVDRVTRLWVPLVPALFLSCGAALACGIKITCGDFLGNLFGLQGIACVNFGQNEPLWSLSYEIWFYALIGALASALTYSSGRRLVAIGIVAVAAAVFCKLSPWLLICWLTGAAGFFFTGKKTGWAGITLGLIIAAAGGVISQARSGTSVAGLDPHIFGNLPSRNLAVIIESLGVCLFVISVINIQPNGRAWSAIEETGHRLAAFSFTLYLTHYPMLKIWERFGPPKQAGLSTESYVFFCGKSRLMPVRRNYPIRIIRVQNYDRTRMDKENPAS